MLDTKTKFSIHFFFFFYTWVGIFMKGMSCFDIDVYVCVINVILMSVNIIHVSKYIFSWKNNFKTYDGKV